MGKLIITVDTRRFRGPKTRGLMLKTETEIAGGGTQTWEFDFTVTGVSEEQP